MAFEIARLAIKELRLLYNIMQDSLSVFGFTSEHLIDFFVELSYYKNELFINIEHL